MSFYMTLPSDSSQQYFPENTISHFTTQLPVPVELNGQWEVGLSEMIYPHTWYNINQSNNSFGFDLDENVGTRELETRRIPVGCYESVTDIIKAMTLERFKNKIALSYSHVTKKVKVKTKNGASLIFDDNGLTRVLGFKPQVVEGEWTSPYVADLNSMFSLLYVYTDIVAPQIVGDTQAPLLRVVSVTGKDGEMVNVQYDRPHYVPIVRNSFNTIEVEIRLNSGDFVPFERGKLILVLHFRRRQIL